MPAAAGVMLRLPCTGGRWAPAFPCMQDPSLAQRLGRAGIAPSPGRAKVPYAARSFLLHTEGLLGCHMEGLNFPGDFDVRQRVGVRRLWEVEEDGVGIMSFESELF